MNYNLFWYIFQFGWRWMENKIQKYCKENDIYPNQKYIIQAYNAIDKARCLEFAKWVFQVLMPDLRLKKQNIDLPSIYHRHMSPMMYSNNES